MTSHLCSGPDAGQLIGFLSALGLLHAATETLERHDVRLGFRWHAVGYRPELEIVPAIDRAALVERVHGWIERRASSPELTELGDDLPCDTVQFQGLAHRIIDDGRSTALLAAFGIAWAETERIEDTAFRTMSGAGHQHFLKFAREIAGTTTPDQLTASLFQPWTYEDDKPSLRFDPADDRRYAFRADDPAKSNSSVPIRTVRGANALAFEGLSFLSVVPTARGAQTILTRRERGQVRVRWPIWERPIAKDAVRSLLIAEPNAHPPGILAMFECRRLTVGKFRSFTPAERVA